MTNAHTNFLDSPFFLKMRRDLIQIALICTFFQATFGQININTKKGHPIEIGSSGFNVRIADKVWNYTHPDFRKAVHELRPGWLRFFSGTMGDAFNCATGQYDLDYAHMFDKSKQYIKGYEFTEIKGPHRISDLYQLLGEINGKLVVTINAFSETPRITEELARFVKNNNMEVEVWQFCNEPYFYVPHRERYWWNNGYDYAVKMRPHAEAILKVFPDAQLALNFTWDGIWGFMKEINQYQREHGAYWNTFSKHSYAPHTGKRESLDKAYRRANTKLLEATGKEAMEEVEAYTSKGIPMLITEFGIWNKPLDGIYYSIYNIEYTMRQLQHTNTRWIGAHEVSNKYIPEKDFNHLITEAYGKGKKLDTDSIPTGIHRLLEGKAYTIYHSAVNNSDFVYASELMGGLKVSGMQQTIVEGMFAQAYRGTNGYDYLVVTNRSLEAGEFDLILDGKPLKRKVELEYISADDLTTKNTEIRSEISNGGRLLIRPLSVTVAKWQSNRKISLSPPRIYDLSVTKNGVNAVWGHLEGASEYQLWYGTSPDSLTIKIDGIKGTNYEVTNLKLGKTYYFQTTALSTSGDSSKSKIVPQGYERPSTPSIFKTARRDDTATIMWQSVKNAEGYLLKYISETGKEKIMDTKNVFGFRVEGLEMNVPHTFSVAAYNGLGQGGFSEYVTVIPKENIPYSPRDVSARETPRGSIMLDWTPNGLNPPGTTYIVLRGEKLHDFQVLATNVKSTSFEDTSIEKDKDFFYTVKAATQNGESNFYPNIATPIKLEANYKIEITEINKDAEGNYIIDVTFGNIPLDGYHSFGIIYSNISYLTVEETRVEGNNVDKNKGKFQVTIPKEELRRNSKYAIKAYVNTNGKDLFGIQPDKTITVD